MFGTVILHALPNYRSGVWPAILIAWNDNDCVLQAMQPVYGSYIAIDFVLCRCTFMVFTFYQHAVLIVLRDVLIQLGVVLVCIMTINPTSSTGSQCCLLYTSPSPRD